MNIDFDPKHVNQLVRAIEAKAEAQRTLAYATIFAAVYTANIDKTPLIKAQDAVDHFQRHCR